MASEMGTFTGSLSIEFKNGYDQKIQTQTGKLSMVGHVPKSQYSRGKAGGILSYTRQVSVPQN